MVEFMKRFFIIATILFMGVFTAYSQVHPISSVGRGYDPLSLKYVCQTDSSTLVYAVFTRPDSTEYLALPHELHVSQSDMDYMVMNSYNIPIYDGAMPSAVLFEKERQKLNIVMEFEKFSVNEPFDLILDDLEEDEVYNIYDIRVDTLSVKKIDMKRFLASTPKTFIGKYSDSGLDYTYYDHNGVFVSAALDGVGSRYVTMALNIYDDSDHGALFSTKNITGISKTVKKKKEKMVQLYLLDKKDYRSDLADSDFKKAVSETGAAGMSIVSHGLWMGSIGTPINSAADIGLRALSAVTASVGYQAVKPALQELDKTREERVGNYLQSQSIKAGESLGGILRFYSVDNMTDFKFTLNMDDYDFEFYWTF